MRVYSLRHFFSGTNFLLVIMNSCLPAIFSSCNIINPAEPVPAYVQVDSIHFSADSITQGSSSSKIVDAWVYVDNQSIGTFEMPATVPVLASGVHRLTIRPGILNNGIAASRTAYPFYTAYDTVVNFESAKVIVTSPRSSYYASTYFSLLENFDQTGTHLEELTGSDTSLLVVQDQHSFEGKYGAVYLDTQHPYFACASVDSFPLLTGSSAYVELNFLCNNEFTVGLIRYTAFSAPIAIDIVTFNPSAGLWKKGYVNLTPTIASAAGVLGYKVYIKATKSSDLTSAYLYLDNIKVVD